MPVLLDFATMTTKADKDDYFDHISSDSDMDIDFEEELTEN